MMPRPDLLDAQSPPGLEVFQLTADLAVPASHIYMEAQIFTPDSRRLLLHCSAHPHGSDKDDPRHRYLLCDLENNGRLVPVTDELGATAPSVSPDGRWIYYLINRTEPGGGELILQRRAIDGSHPEAVLVVDRPLPGTSFRPSRIYPLSTISSDGRRLAVSCFLGDGRSRGAPWGLLVFDLPSASVQLIIQGPSWCNMHPQYSRSQDPLRRRDILIQENHANQCDERGKVTVGVGGRGADIHVIRDDGLDFRNLPWGRDCNEFCQGHQCWRGRSDWAITSTVTKNVHECQLIESRPVEHIDHDGLQSPGGQRNDLSREFQQPDFYHFATDMAGRRFISDTGPDRRQGALYLADLGEPGRDPLCRITYLLKTRATWKKSAHSHPFLSPDGILAFFNSDESGIFQAYMIRGLPLT